MKLVLLLIVLVCCLLLGLGISKYYFVREKFYSDLCQFCKLFNLKVSFSKEKLPTIITSSKSSCSDEFNKFLTEYEGFIQSNKDNKEFRNCKCLYFLKSEEKQDIIEYFLSIGEMSATEEIEKSKAKLSFYEELKQKCSNEKNKFSTFYIKLFVILALFVFIIFI